MFKAKVSFSLNDACDHFPSNAYDDNLTQWMQYMNVLVLFLGSSKVSKKRNLVGADKD